MPGNLQLVGELQRNICFHWKTVQSFRLFVWWGYFVWLGFGFFLITYTMRCLECEYTVNLTWQQKAHQNKEENLS